MANVALLISLEEKADSARRYLDTSLRDQTLPNFQLAGDNYASLQASIEQGKGRLGLDFMGGWASLQPDGVILALQLAIESRYGKGIVDGIVLMNTASNNPDPHTSVDSLMQTGIELKRHGEFVLASTQEAYRLGRTLGYARDIDQIRAIFQQIRNAFPTE